MCSENLTPGVERYGRVAAGRGIEPRHPYLDRRLIEYCAWLPLSLRLRDGYPKWALRRAMSAQLPYEIAWRCGRQHLGRHFICALLDRLGADFPATNASDKFGLHEYVDLAYLQQIATHGVPQRAVDELLEMRLSAQALGSWLRGRHA